ncbi:MAG: hypothetical protein LBK76_06430 [Verrucomicrobiales bacterium]|jgi:hypothetical protein|nr:hypothetical protein [Verrucomicrobiales bacterium]
MEANPTPVGQRPWKTRHPFGFGLACGALAGAVVISGGGLLYLAGASQQATALKTVEAQRVNLLRPLVTGSAAAEPAPAPADLTAECAKFVADLRALQTRADGHIADLRANLTAAYLASRASEIDFDALTAKADTLKQDLADFQETYPRIEPLINALTPGQISETSALKEQFTKYQRLSARFDNTLASIDDYRQRLADREAYASLSAATATPTGTGSGTNASLTLSGSTGGDVITNVSDTTTVTESVTTVTSQPGTVYTEPAYYYDTTPTWSIWFSGGYYYDPFWRTAFWPSGPRHHRHHYPPPPPAPRPPTPHPPAPRPPTPRPPAIAPAPARPQPLPANPPSANRPRPAFPAPPRTPANIPANRQPMPSISVPAPTNPRPAPSRPTTQPAAPADRRPASRPTPATAPASRPASSSSRPAPAQQQWRQSPPPRQQQSAQPSPRRQSPASAPRPAPANRGGGNRHR